jgi:hypothetical protein
MKTLNASGTDSHQGCQFKNKDGHQQGGKQYQCYHPEWCQEKIGNIQVGEYGLAGQTQQELADNPHQRGEQGHTECHIGKVCYEYLSDAFPQNSRHISVKDGYDFGQARHRDTLIIGDNQLLVAMGI